MPRVGIVDYRMGNLASVAKALEKVRTESFVSEDPEALAASDIVVLPGVGNFAAGMANLRRGGLDAFVREWAEAGRPTWWRRGSTTPTAAVRARRTKGLRRQSKSSMRGWVATSWPVFGSASCTGG